MGTVMFKRLSERSPRMTSLACWCLALLLAAGAVALDRLPPVKGEDKNDFPLLTKDDFKNLGPFSLGGGPKHAEVSARFTRPSGDQPGML